MRRIINHKVYDTNTALAVGGYKFQSTRYTYYRKKIDGELFLLQEELDRENKPWTANIIAASLPGEIAYELSKAIQLF